MSSNKSSGSSGGRRTNKNKTSKHGKSDHQSKSSNSTKHDKKTQQKSTRMEGGVEDSDFMAMVKFVMEMTGRTDQDEVIMVMNDNGDDLLMAINELLY